MRKHGAYFTAEALHKVMSDPRELAKLLNTLADEQEKNRQLEEENAFLSVKAKYYDQILSSKNAVPVTQIANLNSIHGALLRMNRSIQAEGTYGTIKWNRSYTRVRRRGIKALIFEIGLICCGFNLHKFHLKKLALKSAA